MFIHRTRECAGKPERTLHGRKKSVINNLFSPSAKSCDPPEGQATTKLISELVKLNLNHPTSNLYNLYKAKPRGH